MEIIKGFKHYDVGYLVYDLWTLAVIAFLCVLILYFIKQGFSKLSIIPEPNKTKTLDYLLPMIMVIGQVSTTSDVTRLVLLIIMLIIFLILKRKKDVFVSLTICALVGFGLNILPIAIASLIFVAGVFINRKKQIV